MRYINLKNYKNHQKLGAKPPDPLLPPAADPHRPSITSGGFNTQNFMFVSHYEFIKYASACYYKYTSIVPVQTFYSVILIRVNKKVLPLHNLPLPPPPKKKNFQLATSLVDSAIFRLFFWCPTPPGKFSADALALDMLRGGTSRSLPSDGDVEELHIIFNSQVTHQGLMTRNQR